MGSLTQQGVAKHLGWYDSSRTGKRGGQYSTISGGKRGFSSKAQRDAYNKREKAKGDNPRTVLTSMYA